MKKIILFTILSLAALIFAACQNTETTNSTANNAAANSTANATENKNTTVANNPTTSAKPTGFPPSNLKPENVSPDKPVPAEELRNAVLAWEGKEVSVIGYPSFPTLMGSNITLKGAADADPQDFKNLLVECSSKQQFGNESVDGKQPIVVRGVIKGYPFHGDKNPKVNLQDCQIVSKGEFSGEKGVADPSKIDPNKPIPAADLHKDFLKWMGKQVAVTGNYNGHTKSSGTSGETIDIRIDVQNDKYQTVVECHIANDPGADDFKERNNRVFKGAIAGGSSTSVTLKPCEYVK
ncbi:MAG TPA: hypothetical protein VK892_09495 [Pyrinomonadaceae bacterium]|nr:hypothetical protein [Pyrinomonadaceae bacterium]